MTESRTRTFTLDRAEAKGDRFPCVAATETPIKRSFGYEVLDMSRMDLSRAPIPVIESHNQRNLNIGVLEDPRIVGDKVRGMIRLGSSARAKEVSADIEARIICSVSVGYEAWDPIESGEIDGIPVYRFAAQIHELSLVAAPADIRTGIFRSKEKTMDVIDKKAAAETQRISSIEALAEKYELEALGIRAIAAGDTVQAFNAAALKEIDKRNERAASREQESDRSLSQFAGMPCDNTTYGVALNQYSLVRVMRGLSDPRQLSEASLEMEISQDMQRVLGRRSKGVLVPWEALQTRAVTVSGTGSNLVATDHLAGSFIDVLRNRSLVMSLGPTVLRGLVGDVEIPRKTAGAVAYWIGADNADSITASDIALDALGLTPHTVGGAVTYSHKVLIQSSPDIEQLVRQDLADLIATEIDAKAINGSGSSNQPLGILNTSGIGSDTYALAGDPSWEEYVAMETALADANADMGNLAYLLTPTLAGTAKTTPRQGDGVEGNFIWQGGMINDIKAYKTKNVPAGYAILGNWQHLILGFWGGIELDADPYGSNFLKGSVTIRVIGDVDVGVRYPGAFSKLYEALA